MSDHANVGGVLQIPVPGGTVKLMRHVTNQVKIDYEDWLYGSALRRIYDVQQRFKMPQDLYKENLKSLNDSIASFSWGGDACVASWQMVPGIVTLVTLLAQDADRETGVSQHVTESKVLSWIQDDTTCETLKNAVTQILASDKANFLDPPTRGAAS